MMDLEIIILNEVNQAEKYKYYILSHIWNLKKDRNELNRNKVPDIEKKLMVTKGKKGWRSEKGKLGVWDYRYILSCIKEIVKDLLYSTGNYSQYLVITYNNGIESEAVRLKLIL